MYGRILVLFILFLVPSVEAQIGIKAGLGVSDITFKERGQTPYLGYEINSIEHRIPLVTFQIGMFSSFDVSDYFVFQPELLYATQGLDYSTKYVYDDIKYKIKSSYIQIPLLFKYNTRVKRDKLSGILLGPYASLKLNANRITQVEGQREKSEMTNIKQTDFGLIAGYIFDFNLASRNILIDLRSSYSLINMMDRIDGYIKMYNGPKKAYARNISITFSIAYNFDIGKKEKNIER